MSKKVIILFSLSFLVIAVMCGTMIPYLVKADSGNRLPPNIPGQTQKTDQNTKDDDGDISAGNTPPESNDDIIKDDDVDGIFFAKYSALGMWDVEPFDFEINSSDFFIKDTDISVHFFTNEKIFIPGSDISWTGTQIYLVNSDNTYILYLVDGEGN